MPVASLPSDPPKRYRIGDMVWTDTVDGDLVCETYCTYRSDRHELPRYPHLCCGSCRVTSADVLSRWHPLFLQ